MGTGLRLPFRLNRHRFPGTKVECGLCNNAGCAPGQIEDDDGGIGCSGITHVLHGRRERDDIAGIRGCARGGEAVVRDDKFRITVDGDGLPNLSLDRLRPIRHTDRYLYRIDADRPGIRENALIDPVTVVVEIQGNSLPIGGLHDTCGDSAGCRQIDSARVYRDRDRGARRIRTCIIDGGCKQRVSDIDHGGELHAGCRYIDGRDGEIPDATLRRGNRQQRDCLAGIGYHGNAIGTGQADLHSPGLPEGETGE
ncbi:hypothetical protein DSECCO2_456160 [anaerobic digester metagenome]